MIQILIRCFTELGNDFAILVPKSQINKLITASRGGIRVFDGSWCAFNAHAEMLVRLPNVVVVERHIRRTSREDFAQAHLTNVEEHVKVMRVQDSNRQRRIVDRMVADMARLGIPADAARRLILSTKTAAR